MKEHCKTQVLPFNLWSTPVRDVQMWRAIVEELNSIKSTYEQCRDSICLGQPLPAVFKSEILALEHLLAIHRTRRQDDLGLLLPDLEAFDKYYVHKKAASGNSLETVIDMANVAKAFNTDPLFWCLSCLTIGRKANKVIDADLLFGFLDHWLAKESTSMAEKDKIEQRILVELSSFAAILEIMAAVEVFTPNSSGMLTEEEVLRINQRSAFRYIIPDQPAANQLKSHQKLRKAYEILSFSVFPTGIRDENWLKSADAVRQSSRNFWKLAHDMQQDFLTSGREEILMYTKVDIQRELSDFLFDSAPEHLAALQAEREAILAPQPRPSRKNKEEYVTPEWDIQSEKKKKFHPELSQGKTKHKTRPTADPSTDSPTADIEQELGGTQLSQHLRHQLHPSVYQLQSKQRPTES